MKKNSASLSLQEPITLVFNWEVKKGQEKEFEKWAHLATEASEKFEGNMGSIWIKPGSNSQDYTVLYKFDTYEHYLAWANSETRKKLLKKVLALTEQEKPKKIKQLSGLETWFTLPGTMTIKPPPKWKMLVTTMLGVFPVMFLVQLFIAPLTQNVNVLLRSILYVFILPPILTYVIMPNMTKLFTTWLYPKSNSS